ncbi:MAG: acetyl-CoA carboxylase biotin carboxyl carrier protein [Pseudomonadales bacterium]
MDLRKIKKLIELVEESGISELEVKSGDEAVRIARPTPFAAPTVMPEPQSAAAVTTSAPGPAQAAAPDLEVRAPMAGTFYAAPEPGASVFVAPGQLLQAESVVCIIESMKMMNEIRLDSSGECVEMLVANGEPVSARQLLFRFRSPA